jgi:hypothetical protein
MEPSSPDKEEKTELPEIPKSVDDPLDDAVLNMATFVADDQKHAPSRQSEPETIDPTSGDILLMTFSKMFFLQEKSRNQKAKIAIPSKRKRSLWIIAAVAPDTLLS